MKWQLVAGSRPRQDGGVCASAFRQAPSESASGCSLQLPRRLLIRKAAALATLACVLLVPPLARSQATSFTWTPAFSTTVDVLSARGGPASALGRAEGHVQFDFGGKRSIVVDAAGISGGDVSSCVGATQAVSNIEAHRAFRLLDLFAQAAVGNGGMGRMGLIDLNAFFYVQGDAAANFLNASHGIGPELSQSSPRGPSVYPDTNFGAVVEHPLASAVLRLGAFAVRPNAPAPDGSFVAGPRGPLVIGELDAGSIRTGTWAYTSSVHAGAGNAGAYVIAEAKPMKSVDAWATAGASNGRFNPVNSYLGGGFAHRAGETTWGAAVASAGFPGVQPRETNVELTLSGELPRGFSIQPDVQWIRHPSGARVHSWVAGMRVSYEFNGTPHRHLRFVRRHRLLPAQGD